MAQPPDPQRSFGLYVTHVDGEGHFLRISGQLDKQSSLMIESLFGTARENLEKGIGAVPSVAIQEGIICAAKYKDGSYYRAKIINTTSLSTGLVGVHFIDFGNKDIISLSTIRFLDSYDPIFLQLRGLATDYYLSRIMHPSGRWEEPLLLKLQSILCNSEYPVTVEAQTRSLPIIAVQFKGTDLSTHLINNRFGVAVPVARQEILLLQMMDKQQAGWSPTMLTDQPTYTEHVPFLVNQNFPNPASAMRMNQNVALQYNGSFVPGVSQRLLVNKTRNVVNLKAPERQLQNTSMARPPPLTATPPPTPLVLSKPTSPKKSITFKSRLLEVNSQHRVYVSYAEEGPELFAVQLVADAKKLQDMMDDINRRPHSSLAEPPMIGTVCLGRMSGDRIICRAIVMNLSGSDCKLFFVDFGNTEMVSYYDIFDIPEEFVKPNIFALRFCLSGVKKLQKSPHLNETFRQLVQSKILTLKVVSPEGPPLIQYGELFLDNKNVLELLMSNMKENLQFKWMDLLPIGIRQSVLVSYVDSCINFYIQLSDKIEELNAVMDAVKAHCENSSTPGKLPVGAICCARFPDDDNWYRAIVRGTKGDKVIVAYVDYGNEQEVDVGDLRTITPELIRLPAQAMKCALKGFENRPVETKTSNQLEMIALEKTLMAQVVSILSNDTMLVTLVDDTETPPLDVARKMNQLSQPRISEAKATTPVRKDAPESFTSPEGSEDGRKKSFRREKSFKDERRPRDSEEFGQRGSSFRGRDQNESFERSAPARHSDKYGAKPERAERGERRGPPKPRDNHTPTSPPAAADDEWEESPPQAMAPSASSRPPRDNPRDRRKPKAEQHDKKGAWKKEGSGVGKRLKQAAEAASLDAQNSQTAPQHKGASIQDRLRRDNRFGQQDDDNQSNDRGRNFRQDRQDRSFRSDNRGERRENWGDKKEGWNQKRELRDNRAERGDRNDRGGDRGYKSNFTPRDRADRTDSDNDKRSERSFRSQGSGDNYGRAPYKGRKFTQPKELTDPLPFETPFAEPSVEIGSQQEVSVTWIVSPANFHTQILSLQPKFLEMMHKIPELYKGVKPFAGDVPIGASVLARYPADGVLYRATVVASQPFSKYIVRYVDFGNKQLVDAMDIWQMERELIELPKMAVHCSLVGVAPVEGSWKADPEIDLCFNAPRYQCIFQECIEEQYKVSLWNNGVSVADMLVEKNLAIMSESQSSVTLKDEAIDLTIIVGQQILCQVTHVESFEKFFVQLDLEKAKLVESAIAEFDVAKLTPITADDLTVGVHCTVRHDGKIHRAILNDVSDPASIQAVLPDYGNVVTTSLDNVMILPTELSVYYYQSLQCRLNNYCEQSTQLLMLDELRARLTGHKFIIYINDVDEITLVSTLYDLTTGQKIAIFEPDEGAYDEVVQLCTRAVFNYNFGNAYLSHIENLNEFYLQKAADGDRIALLLEELYAFYEEGTPEPLTEFEVDALCAAKSSDSNWYRATIISSTDEEVKVQFSDYGNSETVAKDAVKKLDPKFFEPCCLALVAGFGLIALQEDAVAKLTEWTMEKEVQVTLAFGSDGWLANLHLDGVDLSVKLVNEKLAASQAATVETPEQVAPAEEEPVEERISLPEGCTQVYISHIDSPGQFWLQMFDKVDKIDEIQAELQANADAYADIETREIGTICVAKYSVDDQWYRAEILDSDSDITTIRFLDYGNTDVLDNEPGLIKAVPEHLKDIERYAVKASVNAIPTGTGQWSEPASDHFTQLCGDLSNPVDALVVHKDVTTYVDIFVNGQNLTDKLVAEGHATRSEDSECGNYPSCFASHVNSPSEFWIQLESAAPELQSMETAMVDAENFPELSSKEEGVLCAAKYPEDGAWYRAQVIVDGSEGTEVLFMDYGNASIVNELRSLPEELQSKPALSRKCALQKPPHVKAWSRKSEVKFNELAAEGATIFNVQFVASGDISIVDLFLEGKSVSDELAELCEELPASERPTPVGQDLHSSGKICFVNSLEEFYVQLDDSSASLDKVTERLEGAEDFEAVGELKVGSVCAAFWAEDEKWYRAKILEFCDVGYHVQFIDYGNKSKCEDFRQLPEDIAGIEPLAKCCRLAGFTDDPSNESAKSKLEDLEAELVTFQIEFLDSLKEPSLVKLLLNGTDISCILKSDSPAPNTESDSLVDQKEPVNDSTVEQNVKEMVGEQIEKVLDAVGQSGEIKNSAVEGNELVKDMVAEQIEKVVDLVEQSGEVENSAVEGNELVKDMVAEQIEKVVDLVEQSGEVENSAVEGNALVKDMVAEQIEKVVDLVEQSGEVENSTVEGNELVKDMVAEQIEKVLEAVEQSGEVENSTVEGNELVKDMVAEQIEKVLDAVEQSGEVRNRAVEENELVKDMVAEQIEKVVESAIEQVSEKHPEVEGHDDFHDAENTIGDANDLNTTPQDLNESLGSTNTVIECGMEENDVPSDAATTPEHKIATPEKEVAEVTELLIDIRPLDESKTSSPEKESPDVASEPTTPESNSTSTLEDESLDNKTLSSPEKDVSAETLSANDSLKTEKEDSRESLNTDTGYGSESNKEKSTKEPVLPVKSAEDGKKPVTAE